MKDDYHISYNNLREARDSNPVHIHGPPMEFILVGDPFLEDVMIEAEAVLVIDMIPV